MSSVAGINDKESGDESAAKVKALETLCGQKDIIIKKLHLEVEQQKAQRSEEVAAVEDKTNRIREWVSTRLRELEQQNEKLRTQNVKCTKQLDMLRSCAENNSAMWRSSLFTSSLEDSLRKSLCGGDQNKLSSDDSGTTSDVQSSIIDDPSVSPGVEYPISYEQQCTASVERVLSKSTNSLPVNARHQRDRRHRQQTDSVHRLSRSMNATLSVAQNGAYSKVYAVTGYRKPQAVDCAKKPLPTPRKRSQPWQKTTGFDRDVIDIAAPVATSKDSDSCSSPDCDRDSLCNLAEADSSADHTDVDYVNLEHLHRVQNQLLLSASTIEDTVVAETEMNNTLSLLEKRLKQLAQTCLQNSTQEPKVRTSIFSLYEPLKKLDCELPTDVSKKGWEPISSAALPVFTTYYGKVSRVRRSAQQTSNMTRDSQSSNEPRSSQHYTSGSSNDQRSDSSKQSSTQFPGMVQIDGPGFHASSSAKFNESRFADSRASCRQHQTDRCRSHSSSSSDQSDYAVPPDAGDDAEPSYVFTKNGASSVMCCDTSMTASLHCMAAPGDGSMETIMTLEKKAAKPAEKAGYLNRMGDRMKSWRRRWYCLKDGELVSYKSPQDEGRKPMGKILLTDVTAVVKVKGKDGAGFELVTGKENHRFTAELSSVNDEWIKVFQKALNECAASKLSDCAILQRGAVSGWLTKVKLGHSRKCWCYLLEGNLLFFKTPNDKVPVTQVNLKEAHVQEIIRSSSDDSGSDHEAQRSGGRIAQYSISVQPAKQEPTYLILPNREEKDKWLYHLSIANGTLKPEGAPFERLVQKLMAVGGDPNSAHWANLLISNAEPSINEPLTTLPCEQRQKEATQLYKSCYLYSSVAAQPNAYDYHVDLAQSALHQVLKQPELHSELYCQLVKLTCSDLGTNQAWQLLALALSLFLPSQYCVLWLLHKHLEKWMALRSECGQYAVYCQRAMDHTMLNGCRTQRPSRMEVLSLLARNPFDHSWPYSIPVHLPTGNYQLIGFDGSSTVRECTATLCDKLGIDVALDHGFALFADDPHVNDAVNVLDPKVKLCDAISEWEQKLMENRTGKFPSHRVVRLTFRKRYFWKARYGRESEQEQIILAHQANEQVLSGELPVSQVLANELGALMAQMVYGDACDHALDNKFPVALSAFFPPTLREDNAETRHVFEEKWSCLQGLTPSDCARVYLASVRSWSHYGCTMFSVVMRWRADERIWIAVGERGVGLLSTDAKELLVHYPFETILTFGACREDFMLVTNRPSSCEGEPTKERLIFAMPKPKVLEATLLIADYIRLRKQVLPKKSQTIPRSPRRGVIRTPPTARS